MSTPTPAPDDPHADRLIPIVLGVVGHRDIHPEATGKLGEELRKVLVEFEEAYPNSPLVLLTPLAPGADQLAAGVALKRNEELEKERKKPRWTVRAPMAFEPDVFLQSTSFRDDDTGEILDADRKTFEKLIAHPRVDWFVLPVPPELDGRVQKSELAVADIAACTEEGTEAAKLQKAFYANPGGYIVRRCHTLIALWDREHAERPSGTAEAVRFKLGGLSLTHYPWAEYEPLGFDGDRGPVIVLHTPRADSAKKKRTATPKQLEEAGKRTVRVPAGSDDQYGLYYGRPVDVPYLARKIGFGGRLKALWGRIRRSWGESPPAAERYDPRTSPVPTSHPEYTQFLAICQAIDDYNADARGLPPDTPRPADEAATSAKLFPPGEAVPTPRYKTGLGEWFRKVAVVRQTADHLAGRVTPFAKWAPWAASGWLFVILIVLHLYAHPPWHTGPTPPDHPPLLLFTFFALWAILGVVVWVVWLIRMEEGRVDYRSLTEALRAREAWAAAGSDRSVSDAYLGQLRGELVWVRRAVQHLCPPPRYWAEQFRGLTAERQVERLAWVEKEWVRGQRRHHHHRGEYHHTWARWLRRIGFGSFLLGLGVMSIPLILLLPWFAPHPELATGGDAHHPTPPAALAVVGGPAAVPTSPDHAPSWFGTAEHPAVWILCVGGLLVVLGGLLVAVCEKMGHEPLARQHEQMYAVFRGGARELLVILRPSLLARMRDCRPDQPALAVDPHAPAEPTADVPHAQRVIEDLGREAVQENAQWLLGRRSKSLELPMGG